MSGGLRPADVAQGEAIWGLAASALGRTAATFTPCPRRNAGAKPPLPPVDVTRANCGDAGPSPTGSRPGGQRSQPGTSEANVGPSQAPRGSLIAAHSAHIHPRTHRLAGRGLAQSELSAPQHVEVVEGLPVAVVVRQQAWFHAHVEADRFPPFPCERANSVQLMPIGVIRWRVLLGKGPLEHALTPEVQPWFDHGQDPYPVLQCPSTEPRGGGLHATTKPSTIVATEHEAVCLVEVSIVQPVPAHLLAQICCATVGLPTALAPTRASRIRFAALVGATGAANENATINIQHR